jgi:hypothetical protein
LVGLWGRRLALIRTGRAGLLYLRRQQSSPKAIKQRLHAHPLKCEARFARGEARTHTKGSRTLREISDPQSRQLGARSVDFAASIAATFAFSPWLLGWRGVTSAAGAGPMDSWEAFFRQKSHRRAHSIDWRGWLLWTLVAMALLMLITMVIASVNILL